MEDSEIAQIRALAVSRGDWLLAEICLRAIFEDDNGIERRALAGRKEELR